MNFKKLSLAFIVFVSVIISGHGAVESYKELPYLTKSFYVNGGRNSNYEMARNECLKMDCPRRCEVQKISQNEYQLIFTDIGRFIWRGCFQLIKINNTTNKIEKLSKSCGEWVYMEDVHGPTVEEILGCRDDDNKYEDEEDYYRF